VAQAFHRVAGTAVVVLYPQGRVSPLQEHQLATLGGNVRALAVTGTFDDCQRLAKEAFADRALAARVRLTSANSINLGRLLPQAVYYAHAVAQLPPGSPPPCFVVPSGNFGNLTAGVLAARRGVPTGPFVAAVNANRAFPDYLATGVHRPRPSLATLANAMDVGDPSNLARLVALFGGDAAAMGAAIATSSHGDDEIRRAIVDAQRRTGRILDPHTAVGLRAWEEYHRRHRPSGPAVLLATAHPAKFAEVVEPLVGPVTLPPALERFAIGPVARVSIPPEFGALREVLEAPTP
jgi:threonine synthase